MGKFRQIFLFCGLILGSNLIYSQAFNDGTNLIYLGFGLPATSRITNTFDQFKSNIDYNSKNYGTIVLKYEHGLQKYFGVGLNLEYSNGSGAYKYDNTNQLRYQVNITSSLIGAYARLNGHFPIGKSLDIYAGAGLGYTYKIDNYTDTNPSNSNISRKNTVFDFDYQLTLGARYMMKEHFGLFAEFGQASTTAQLGICLGF
jgi:hypothetical protein